MRWVDIFLFLSRDLTHISLIKKMDTKKNRIIEWEPFLPPKIEEPVTQELHAFVNHIACEQYRNARELRLIACVDTRLFLQYDEHYDHPEESKREKRRKYKSRRQMLALYINGSIRKKSALQYSLYPNDAKYLPIDDTYNGFESRATWQMACFLLHIQLMANPQFPERHKGTHIYTFVHHPSFNMNMVMKIAEFLGIIVVFPPPHLTSRLLKVDHLDSYPEDDNSDED